MFTFFIRVHVGILQETHSSTWPVRLRTAWEAGAVPSDHRRWAAFAKSVKRALWVTFQQMHHRWEKAFL